jgi:hypothetical protein
MQREAEGRLSLAKRMIFVLVGVGTVAMVLAGCGDKNEAAHSDGSQNNGGAAHRPQEPDNLGKCDRELIGQTTETGLSQTELDANYLEGMTPEDIDTEADMKEAFDMGGIELSLDALKILSKDEDDLVFVARRGGDETHLRNFGGSTGEATKAVANGELVQNPLIGADFTSAAPLETSLLVLIRIPIHKLPFECVKEAKWKQFMPSTKMKMARST